MKFKLIPKTFFQMTGQFAGCKNKFEKVSLVEISNVTMSAEQPTEVIPYKLFDEFDFLLKINQMKPWFLILLEHWVSWAL